MLLVRSFQPFNSLVKALISQKVFFIIIIVSDPTIGGTYMTFLNTLSNLGGTWPKYFVLKLVDYLSKSHCSVPNSTETFTCIQETYKKKCGRGMV